MWTGTAVAVAAITLVALLTTNTSTDDLGWDFRSTYLRAAERVLGVHSPYPPLDDAAIGNGTEYASPPQLAVALAPLTAAVSGDLLVWAAFVAALAFLAGAALLALTLHFGPGIGEALVLTPVAWLHYYVLLAVPLALSRPEFSAIWLLPIVLWVCPRYDSGGDLQRALPILATGLVLSATLRRDAAVLEEEALA